MITEYILQRFSDNRESTLGLLFRLSIANPFFIAYTLEDEFRDEKVAKETRIAAGRYEIIINRAETPLTLKYRARYPDFFIYHLMLKDVPDFTGIYIHPGKTDDFTDGCITIGDSANNNNLGHGEITGSVPCYRRIYTSLYDHLDHKENGKYVNQAFITIKDESKLL